MRKIDPNYLPVILKQARAEVVVDAETDFADSVKVSVDALAVSGFDLNVRMADIVAQVARTQNIASRSPTVDEKTLWDQGGR